MERKLAPEREAVLITQACHDAESFRDLFNHYFPKIYAYTAYRIDRVEDVEDIVSEIFLIGIGQLHRFKYRGAGSFSAWLFRIAHNQVSNFYRRRQRHDEPLSLEMLPELRDTTPLPDDIVMQHEQFLQLKRLLSTLPPRQQEALTLRFFGGLQNKEIAQILKLDERTVAANLSRGLEALREKHASGIHMKRIYSERAKQEE